MPKAGTRRAKTPAPSASSELGRPLLSARLRSLLRQQKTLLTKIKQEQKLRERLLQAMQASNDVLVGRLHPLMAQRDRLGDELHAVFGELLGDKLNKRVRAQVEQFYFELCAAFELAPRHGAGTAEEDASEFGAEDFAMPDDAPVSAPASKPDKPGLRELFRRLALALHPDRARDEPERQRRTDVMKQVTRAYESGDLAALLEVERQFASGEAPAVISDFDGRAAALERSVEELKSQLKSLRAEVKQLRRSSPLAFAEALERGERDARAALDESEATLRAELTTLRTFVAFTREFRAKRLSLAVFLNGPAGRPLFDSIERMFEDAFEFELAEIEASHARARRRGARI